MSRTRSGSLAFAAVAGMLLLTVPAIAGSSNSLLDLSTDGQRLVCSNRDSGTVTVFAKESNGQWTRKHELPVGHHPEGVTFLGDSHQIAVAVYDDDKVSLVDGDSGESLGSIEVDDEPYAVVSTSDGTRMYVTLEYPGKIAEIDPADRKVLREFEAGSFPRGLAISHDGAKLFVTEYHTAIMRAIDRESGKETGSWKGTVQDNLSRQITLHPTREKAYVTHIRSRTEVPQGAGAIFPYIAVIDTDREADDDDSDRGSRRKRVQMDSFRGTYVVANPWDIAVAPDGKSLCVVFSGTDDMFVCRVLDDDYRELQFDKLMRTGRNPRAVRYTPDGSQLLIYNALDFTISVIDAVSTEVVQTLTCCESPFDAEMLLGKQLFYSARQPMVGQRWISCSSCHPDGDSDGRTWQQPEGLRSTQPLRGMAWTHPIHWSADRDEVQDFEHTIRGPLMQGRGLIKGELYDSLGEKNGGRSPEADALALYANSHKFSLSPHARRVDETGNRITGEAGLSDAAVRGREVFFRDSVGCAECHAGPYFCDSRAGLLTTHDVGTGNADPSEKMGPAYDTPTLIGLYRSAPYLHHGKAATLEDVLTTFNPDDRHGKTSQLSASEIADLAEFLKALPYEDPEPLAVEAGLTKVEK